jgi:tRNA threonylcarbamoyladenosine biosynthesis protein TsaB
VGLAVARGFGLVLGKPVVGITTLAAIARSSAPEDDGAPVLVALTGKGNEVYCQEFTSSGDKSGDAAVRTLADLAATMPRSIRLAGSAADKVASALDLPQQQIISRMEFAGIRDVAELGLVADPVVSSPSPLYLRPPDATPQTRGRIERQ